MEEEAWKYIEEYKNIYQISNLGRVKSFHIYKYGLILSQIDNCNGYLTAILSINGKCKRKYIHTLVAKAFVPNINNKPEVNHKDLNKYNNNYKNLEWVTKSENIKHAWTNGAMQNCRISDKKNYFGNKPVFIYNKNNELVYSFISIKDACFFFKKEKTFIHDAIRKSNGNLNKLNLIVKLGYSINQKRGVGRKSASDY